MTYANGPVPDSATQAAVPAVTVRPVHWYHIWAGDDHHGSLWREAAEEHFAALEAAEFGGDVHVGITGGHEQAARAWDWAEKRWPAVANIMAFGEGFEMPTIDALWKDSGNRVADTPVLYAHAKGAFNHDPGNIRYRRAMTAHLVSGWRDRVEELRDYDVLGLHWLTHDEFPDRISKGRPMPGGNFWWARAGYLCTLLPVEWYSRYCAEGWVGRGDPKAKGLLPGWPDYWW